MEIKYRAEGAYPEITLDFKNRQYAELLLDDYAGMHSELTAITQYMYHSIVERCGNAKVAEILRQIAMVEMHHMTLLGEVIIQLGIHPVYRGQGALGRNYWSGKFVAYGQSMREQLKSDLDGEREAILTYRRHIEQIDNRDIQSLLQRIIEDEKVHESILCDILKKM